MGDKLELMLEEKLKEKLGDDYIKPDELFKVWHLIDDGIYDKEGRLVAFKEDIED